MSYLGFIITAMKRDLRFWGGLLVFSALCFLPLLIDTPVYGPGILLSEASAALVSHEQSYTSGVYESAPDELREIMSKRISLLEKAKNSDDIHVQFKYIAEYYEVMLEGVDLGYTQGSAEPYSYSRNYADALSSMTGEPAVYSSVRELPAFHMLSYLLGTIPGAVLFLPVIIITARIVSLTGGRTILGKSPNYRSALYITLVASASASLLFLAVSMFPAVLCSFLINGAGPLHQPFALQMADGTILLSVSDSILGIILVVLAGALLLSSIVVCMSTLTSSVNIGLVSGLFLMSLNLIFVGYNPEMLPEYLLTNMCFCYLDPSSVCASVGKMSLPFAGIGVSINPQWGALLNLLLAFLLILVARIHIRIHMS